MAKKIRANAGIILLSAEFTPTVSFDTKGSGSFQSANIKQKETRIPFINILASAVFLWLSLASHLSSFISDLVYLRKILLSNICVVVFFIHSAPKYLFFPLENKENGFSDHMAAAKWFPRQL